MVPTRRELPFTTRSHHHPVGLPYLQLVESGEHLLKDGSDHLEGQRRELVLLEEVVEVLLQHLEDETGVVLVLEALEGSDEVVIVRILLTESGQNSNLRQRETRSVSLASGAPPPT